MSASLVCSQCGKFQKSGTFDPFKRCEKCDAPPQCLQIEGDEYDDRNDEEPEWNEMTEQGL